MSKVSRGNAAEVLCVKQLESKGWICGSRRHIGGAGDVLAVKFEHIPMAGEHEVALIEVKRGRQPYENFRRPDREALLSTALELGADAFLYWYPTGQTEPVIYHSSAWPESRQEAA